MMIQKVTGKEKEELSPYYRFEDLIKADKAEIDFLNEQNQNLNEENHNLNKMIANLNKLVENLNKTIEELKEDNKNLRIQLENIESN